MSKKNLAARFSAMKQRVAGNQEKQKFSFTMGPTDAEKAYFTPLTSDNRRILSQLHFALGLSEQNGGVFDPQIDAALTLLEQTLDSEGVLTRSICTEAEQLLLPLQKSAKEYTVIYASHAHIDMNWLWGWQETVAATLSTFRTILNLMGEYPDFTYSQSQASVYKIVEEYDPDMMVEIQQRIREGRWEVTANAWVETDKNMPDTESLVRHIRLTRQYLQETWGIDPASLKVDFSPDTFGHSAFVPEINTFGNVPYYYHCRGLQDELTLYRYRAPSGNEILVYKEPYWYNSGINPDNGTGVFEIERRCAGLKTSLIVYGVGNHGGGPTRRDIETMLEMQAWPIFPTLRFGTIHEYFAAAESVRNEVPLIEHELNAIFSGCYTTQSRIKLANRRAESGLLESETMNALTHFTLDAKVPQKRYDKAWENVLFTHFHDILTGSGVQETREYAMGRLAEAIACSQTEQAKSYEMLSRNVDTSMFQTDCDIAFTASEGAGTGYGIASYAGVPNPERGAGKTRIYTVFNPSSAVRNETVEFTVWDYNGNLQNLEVVDHNGNAVPFQLLDEEPQHYWDHRYIRVLVQANVPAMGHSAYVLREKEITNYPTHIMHIDREELPKGDMVLENEYLKATFDFGSGMMYSLISKATGEELLRAPAGLNLVHCCDDGMSAWRIGRYMGIHPVLDTMKVDYRPGTMRSSITFHQKIMHSDVEFTVSLDAGATALKYDLKIHWHEYYSAQDYIPVLTYRLPLKKDTDLLMCDVPAGVVNRTARQMDVPALTGVCALTEGQKLALITDCKYGYRLADNVLSATLINTAGDPDPYPERGIHAIKLFVALTDGKPAHLKAQSKALITPMVAVPTARHQGIFPASTSLMEFDGDTAILSSTSVDSDGALMLRIYESEGKDDIVSVRPPFQPKSAVVTDLEGNPIAPATIDEGIVKCTVPAYRLIQLKIFQ